jgi:hypothetical protein
MEVSVTAGAALDCPPAMDLREIPDEPSIRHPWEVARLRFFLCLLGDAGILESTTSVLDAGAGDGWLSRQLLAHAQTVTRAVCWDRAYTAELLDRLGIRPDSRLMYQAEQPEEAFDLVLALDVLEHVEDDTEFLRTLVARNARSGTAVLISVPAWPQLYSRHDRLMHHCRRYIPSTLTALIGGAGLRVVSKGGLFHTLLVPRLASKLLGRVINGTNAGESRVLRWRGGPLLADLVARALRIDTTLSRAAASVDVDLPGLSCWALCRKP